MVVTRGEEILTTIGYLGPKGTFTKLVTDLAFNGEEKISYKTIPQCMDAVEKNEVDIAVVPIENAIEGTVLLTLDYLVHQVNLPVEAEVVLPIQQHLLVHPNFEGDISDLKEVHSHNQAIAQCHQFLHENMPNATINFASSTGGAAEFVSKLDDKPIAAIANKLAAREYGLKILKENIHDYKENHTRFFVLTKNKQLLNLNHEKKGEKTTLVITLPDDLPGALHQILSAFAWRKMNLSKIESRPTKTGLGNYFFVIDVVQPDNDVLIPNVIQEVEALGCQVNILGTYPVYQMNP